MPTLVNNAANGYAGVRFDGSNDYIWTETSNTMTNATMIVVTQLGILILQVQMQAAQF